MGHLTWRQGDDSYSPECDIAGPLGQQAVWRHPDGAGFMEAQRIEEGREVGGPSNLGSCQQAQDLYVNDQDLRQLTPRELALRQEALHAAW
jgi:hypothetical protein